LTCPRLGVFSGRLTNVAYDPQKADALLADFRQQKQWVHPPEPASGP
jgi:hypothetical protein